MITGQTICLNIALSDLLGDGENSSIRDKQLGRINLAQNIFRR